MSGYDVFPDSEAIVGTWLRDGGLAVGQRVYSSIPKTPTFPLITLRRIGGLPAEKHRLDRPMIQVDVWGTSKSEAQDIAQEARTRLHELEGQSVTGAVVAGVADTLGMSFIPDPPTARDRYIFGVSLVVHAA